MMNEIETNDRNEIDDNKTDDDSNRHISSEWFKMTLTCRCTVCIYWDEMLFMCFVILMCCIL